MKLTDDSGEDDYPAIAVGKDSTAWAVWQSYGDQFDEVRLAKHQDKWRSYTVLPGVSGDVWRPQVAIGPENKPTVVWSQQVKGNFDLLRPDSGSGTKDVVENASLDVPPELGH